MRTATAISFLGTANPQAGQSTFHRRSLGRVNDSPTELEIHSSADRLILCRSEPKQSKNRLHLDFRPDDQQAQVARFLRPGARRVDIGQRSSPWVVLADPEDNEFFVLRREGPEPKQCAGACLRRGRRAFPMGMWAYC
jgi:hypothetical protein